MARVISELPVHSYGLLEEGCIEGLLVSFSHDENDKNSNCVETLLNRLLEYLSSKLFTDSGVSSDHDFSDLKTTNGKTEPETVLERPSVQPVVAGVHVYSNGDVVKMKKSKNPAASYNGKKKKMASNSQVQIDEYHRKCVDLLWRSKRSLFIYCLLLLLLLLLFRMVLNQARMIICDHNYHYSFKFENFKRSREAHVLTRV